MKTLILLGILGLVAQVPFAFAAEHQWDLEKAVSKVRKLEEKLNRLGHAVVPFVLDPYVPGILAENLVLERLIKKQENGFEIDKYVTESEVLGALAKSKVILLADYHSVPTFQRRAEKVLDFLNQQNSARPKLFIFELIDAAYQKDVDDYFQNKISAEDLHEKVKWQKNIGYAWDSYLHLLDYLKKNEIKTFVVLRPDVKMSIYDINPRNQYVFERVKSEIDLHPETQVVVLHGRDHFIGEGGLQDLFNKTYSGDVSLYFFDLPKIHLDLLSRGVTVDESLHLRLRGNGIHNTFYGHYVDVLPQESSNISLAASLLSDDKQEKKAFTDASVPASEAYKKLTGLLNTGDFNKVESQIEIYKMELKKWAESTKDLKNPGQFTNETLKAIDKFL